MQKKAQEGANKAQQVAKDAKQKAEEGIDKTKQVAGDVQKKTQEGEQKCFDISFLYKKG